MYISNQGGIHMETKENAQNIGSDCNNHSTSINEIAKALSNTQQEMRFAKKDSNNPFYKSRYADLASIWDVCREPLTKNGLSVTQLPLGMNSDGYIRLQTILMHTSGQWIKSEIQMKPVDGKPQSYGSTLTYARRYALSAVVGVVQDDDDGNDGSGVYDNKKTQNYQTTITDKNTSPIKTVPAKTESQKTLEYIIYKCHKCQKSITKQERDYSISKFKVSLCRQHQNGAT
jgi:hypothetical protein